MEMTERPAYMYKEILVSLSLHAILIAVMLAFGTFSYRQPETIRVVLTPDPSGGGGGGGKAGPRIAAGTKNAPTSMGRQQGTSPTRREDRPVTPAPTPANHQTLDKAQVNHEPQPGGFKEPSEAKIAAAASGAARASSGGEGAGHETGRGIGTGFGTGSGSGGGIGSGVGEFSGPGRGRGESAESLKKHYLKANFAYIRDLILKNLGYPPAARRQGWKGRTRVAFIVKEDGKVEEVRILESSGYDVLDRNVAETIRKVQPFPKPPVRAELIMPVVYTLE